MNRYSIYIHLPFCLSKCPYCDFYSVETAKIPFSKYIERVAEEWRTRRPFVRDFELVSIYIGGGTPSLWPSREIAGLLGHFEFDSSIEVTVEINPGDGTGEWYRDLVVAGVNRFSIGAQSIEDERLKWLGRRHDAAAVGRAVTLSRKAGAESVSLDFMYGLPGQTTEMLTRELSAFANLDADHISAYELSAAEGTPLHGRVMDGTVRLPDSDESAILWQVVGDSLERKGYKRYEVSSYARGGHLSRHNSHYWRGGFYFGLGAGAHGFVLDMDGRMCRYANPRSVSKYMGRRPTQSGIELDREGFESDSLKSQSYEVIDELTHAREKIMLGLRTSDGFAYSESVANLPEAIQDKWIELLRISAKEELIRFEGEKIVPTSTGMMLADTIAEKFF